MTTPEVLTVTVNTTMRSDEIHWKYLDQIAFTDEDPTFLQTTRAGYPESIYDDGWKEYSLGLAIVAIAPATLLLVFLIILIVGCVIKWGKQSCCAPPDNLAMFWITRIIVWIGVVCTVICMIVLYFAEADVYRFVENFTTELEYRSQVEFNRAAFVAQTLVEIEPTTGRFIIDRWGFDLEVETRDQAQDFSGYLSTFNKVRQGVLYSASILVLISCLISLIGALPFKKIPASINKSAPFCALVVSLLLWVCIVVVVAFSVTASDLCRDALLFRNNVTQFPNNTAQYSIREDDALVFQMIHDNNETFDYETFPLSFGAPDLMKCMPGLEMHQMINYIYRWQYFPLVDPNGNQVSMPGSGAAPLFASIKDPLISAMSCDWLVDFNARVSFQACTSGFDGAVRVWAAAVVGCLFLLVQVTGSILIWKLQGQHPAEGTKRI